MSREQTILRGLATAARAAGMVDDPDALRMLDTTAVTIAVDGSVVIPHRFFEQQRRAKPHLFKPGQPSGIPAGFDARTASPEDYAANRQRMIDASRRPLR
jgi:hypothetical protein